MSSLQASASFAECNEPQPQPQTPATSHVPVMLDEVVRLLSPRPAGLYIDATAGGGGHSLALLLASAPDGRVLSLDADSVAVSRVRQRLQHFGARACVVQANFRQLATVASQFNWRAIDGIVFDLGLSSDQLGQAGRGFSLLEQDAPLDMRFDANQAMTAAELVNTLPENDLADLIYRYGEDRLSRRIARAIVAARPVHTTGQLSAAIAKAVGRQGRLHPATRTFQALRIAVNEELAALSEALPQARDLLRPGGRLAVISFHSLEDRIVKQFMQREARDCICPPDALVCSCQHKATIKLVTRKPLQPSPAELKQNPRSRSAKLRVAERLVTQQ